MRRLLFALVALGGLLGSFQAEAACAGGTCFWIGGTGTLNLASDSAHWSTSSGGTTCSCEPATTDDLVLDGSSGGGTVTVTVAGGTLTANSITMGAFTGTLDFATSNNNVTLAFFNGSGSGTRTLNLGNGTWSLTRTANQIWLLSTTTGLTFNANSSTISTTGTPVAFRQFLGGGLTYHALNINASSSWPTSIIGNNTFSTLTISAPNIIDFGNSNTQTITTLTNISGSASTPTLFDSNAQATQATLSVGNAFTCNWCAFRDIAASGVGSITGNNSFSFGDNTGITVNAPSGGGGGGSNIIGGGL